MTLNLFVLVTVVFIATPAFAQQTQNQNPRKRAEYPTPETVEQTNDIVYARYGDRELKLDLFMPKKRSTGLIPGIIVIHGGGWRNGVKDGFQKQAAFLAERGFAAATIDYRLSGEAVFPAAVNDCKAAVRWMRANADRLGINSEYIGATGGSAGAHLAALIGVTHNIPELKGEGGNPEVSSRVQAVVAMANPADMRAESAFYRSQHPDREEPTELFVGMSPEENPRVWDLVSPMNQVDKDSPPTLLIHSNTDQIVSYSQSVLFAEALQAVNVSVQLITIDKAPHGFWTFDAWFQPVMTQTADFFSQTLQPDQPAP